MLKTVPKPTLPKFHDLPKLFAPDWASKALKGRLQEANSAGEAAARARGDYVRAFEEHAKSWDNPAALDPGNAAGLTALRSQQLQTELHCRELADKFVLDCDTEGKAESVRLYQALTDAKRLAGEVLTQAGFSKYADPKWIELDAIYNEYDGVKAAYAAIEAFRDDLHRLGSSCNTLAWWTAEVRDALLRHRQTMFAAAAAG